MIEYVNGLEIGWEGITPSEMDEQRRIARLQKFPIERCRDPRRAKPYGRLIPLYRVAPEKAYASRSARWLCRCTCWKRSLVVVLAQNLLTTRSPTTGCGCVHKIRASENLAALKKVPEFARRQGEAAGANLARYRQENPEEAREHARRNGRKNSKNPHWLAGITQRARASRVARGFDPDTPISTHYVQIRHAIAPLTQHILRVRDDFTCALCTRRGRVTFEVHHCSPVDSDWRRVGDPSNLITLCEGCHFEDAHAGNWKRVDPEVQAHLLTLAKAREAADPTPPDLVSFVAGRLVELGARLGRSA